MGWQRRCIWLIAFPLFHVEAKRAAAFIEDAAEVESLSSYVVFLQTRLHSEPPRTEVSRKLSGGALANSSSELSSMSPKQQSHRSQSNTSKSTSSSNALVNKTAPLSARHGGTTRASDHSS
eukprot:s529_g13.t2